ncbi:hypothetical protein GCM10009078_48510 [Cupriavidus gilardii]
MQHRGLRLPAIVAQRLLRAGGLLGQRRALDDAGAGQRGAAVGRDGAQRRVEADRRRLRVGRVLRRAQLQQVGHRRVVVQRAAVDGHRRAAAPHGDAGILRHVQVRLADRDAVDQALHVGLGRSDRRAAAIGQARGDHQQLVLADGAAALAVAHLAMAVVDRPDAEFDRLQREQAPVLLGIALRMRVLEGEPMRRRGDEGGARVVVDRRGEMRLAAGGGAAGAGAVDQRDGVVGEILRRGAGALVGIGHRAAALQPPFAGRDAAVDAARAGRRGGDQARPRGIEAGRDLHHHRDVLPAAAVVGVGQILDAGDLALAAGDIALRIDIGSVQRAVAARRADIDQRLVVAPDRIAAQLGAGRRVGIGRQRRGAGQSVLAEPGGQQIVGVAVVVVHRQRADIGGALVDRSAMVVVIVGAAARQRHAGQRNQQRDQRRPPSRSRPCPGPAAPLPCRFASVCLLHRGLLAWQRRMRAPHQCCRYCMRSLCFSIFPEGVRGKASTTRTWRGTL